MNDLVTIVIPAYNAEQFLRENVEAILDQSYRNLEIIYVCDGCTDHTVEILREYAEKDSRIRLWIETENHGAAISRNIGMNIAKGEWIIFWDADDLFHCRTIESMIETAIKEQADIAGCYWERFDNIPSGDAQPSNEARKLYCSTYPVINTEEELYHIMQLVDNSPCTKLVHKSIYMKEEVYFQDIPNANDVYYSMVTAMNSHRIAYVDKALWYYRNSRGRNTISTDRNLKKNYIFEACDRVYEYIKSKGNNLLLLRSFYNVVLDNFAFCMDFPIYDSIFDVFRNVYLDKWGMGRDEIVRELSYINRIYYRNIMNNNRELDRQNVYIQAKLEFVRVLSHKGCSIWGAGLLGNELLEQVSGANIEIQHVFDSAQDKWGKKIHGYIIENFEEVQADNIIITTPNFYNEIAKQIKRSAENIYNLEQQIWLVPCKYEPWNETY